MLTAQREGRTEIIYYVIPLIATVSMAVVSDFRDWRIPNRLIAVGMIQGFLMSAVVRGPCDGLLSSVAGCVIPVVILFVLFLLFGRRSYIFIFSFKRSFNVSYES